jgi:hypothetical protein
MNLQVTKWLIYNAGGQITAHNPSGYEGIEFPNRILRKWTLLIHRNH